MHIFIFLFISMTISFPVVAKPKVYCADHPQNLKTYLDIHEVLFMERDTSRVEEFYGEKIISHNSDGGGPGSIVTPERMRKMWDASRENHPKRVLDDELILCVDSFVIVRTTIKSHFNTPLEGYPPTGEAYTSTATDIYRFEGGKVVERWGNAERFHELKQLGFKLIK
jgi:predicted ester cyclase